MDKCGALRARQLAKKLVRGGVDEARVILGWAPGGDAPFLIEASTCQGGFNLQVPRDELPPEDGSASGRSFAIWNYMKGIGLLICWRVTSAKLLLRGSDEDRCNHEESDSIPRCSIPDCHPFL